MSLNSSAFISWPVACSVNARCGPMMLPAGTLTFHARSAFSTSLMPIWRAPSGVRIELRVHGVLLRAEHLHLRHAADL